MCDRDLQRAQEISACDITSHFGLHPGQGRGSTEIDIIEVMAGPNTMLPLVKENVRRPYCAMTLQVGGSWIVEFSFVSITSFPLYMYS